ncbi:MAG: hypothetical protein LBK22_08845 [Tannerella sp.]|jgi:hypothetical protein|nr:hypothetical protein [Tannerella sp.]
MADYIPDGDPTFDVWQENFMTILKADYARFGILLKDLEPLVDLQEEWVATYTVAKNRRNRTSADVAAKTEAGDTYKNGIRKFKKRFLVENPDVSDADVIRMGFRVPKKHHTRAKVPTSHPAQKNVRHLSSRVYEFHVVDSEHEGRAKPEGVHGFEMGYLFGVAGQTVAPEQFTHSAFSTATPLLLTLPPEALAQTLYLAYRWENTRGEKGPWSEVYEIVVG